MTEEFAEGPPTLPSGLLPVRSPKSDLEYIEVEAGEGTEASDGSEVQVHYRGWLTQGTLFDSTLDRGPLSFCVGEEQVIPALEEGVSGMRVGGRRRLIVPSDLAYGSEGDGRMIPPYATLIFDIELVDLR